MKREPTGKQGALEGDTQIKESLRTSHETADQAPSLSLSFQHPLHLSSLLQWILVLQEIAFSLVCAAEHGFFFWNILYFRVDVTLPNIKLFAENISWQVSRLFLSFVSLPKFIVWKQRFHANADCKLAQFSQFN